MTDTRRDVAADLLERLQMLVQDGPGTVYPACKVCDANLFMDGHTDDCPVPGIEDALLRSEGRELDRRIWPEWWDTVHDRLYALLETAEDELREIVRSTPTDSPTE